MKKILPIFIMGAAFSMISCGGGTETVTAETTADMNFTDRVALAIEQGGKADLQQFAWVNQPAAFSIEGDTLKLTTGSATDLWMNTFVPGKVVNAPIYSIDTEMDSFTLTARTDFADAKTMYDQCGLCVYVDDDKWLKCSVEFTPTEGQLGSVMNTDDFSDWATSPIPSDIKVMWYQLIRKGADFMIMFSTDGQKYNTLRMCHLKGADKRIKVGLYACSPGKEAGFTAQFTDVTFGLYKGPQQ